MIVTITETIAKEVVILPCHKCGNDDINIYNCGYSSFNCAGGKCKECGYTIETHMDWNAPDFDLITAWNKGNDIDSLINELNIDKISIAREIKRLKKIKTKWEKQETRQLSR